MAANSTNSQTTRERFAALLSADLVGVGQPVKQVISYPVARDSVTGKTLTNFETPLIELMDDGEARLDKGMNDQKWINIFRVALTVFIRPADNASGWTEQMVENQMSYVCKRIADVIANNRAGNDAYWSFIGYSLSLKSGEIPEMARAVMSPYSGCLEKTINVYFKVTEA